MRRQILTQSQATMKFALLLVLTIVTFAHSNQISPIKTGFMTQGKQVLPSSEEWVRRREETQMSILRHLDRFTG